MKFSKVTLNFANKRNVELCTSIDNELHLIVNPDENDCASVAYEILEDDTMVILNKWCKLELPEVIKDEKALREVIKLLTN